MDDLTVKLKGIFTLPLDRLKEELTSFLRNSNHKVSVTTPFLTFLNDVVSQTNNGVQFLSSCGMSHSDFIDTLGDIVYRIFMLVVSPTNKDQSLTLLYKWRADGVFRSEFKLNDAIRYVESSENKKRARELDSRSITKMMKEIEDARSHHKLHRAEIQTQYNSQPLYYRVWSHWNELTSLAPLPPHVFQMVMEAIPSPMLRHGVGRSERELRACETSVDTDQSAFACAAHAFMTFLSSHDRGQPTKHTHGSSNNNGDPSGSVASASSPQQWESGGVCLGGNIINRDILQAKLENTFHPILASVPSSVRPIPGSCFTALLPPSLVGHTPMPVLSRRTRTPNSECAAVHWLSDLNTKAQRGVVVLDWDSVAHASNSASTTLQLHTAAVMLANELFGSIPPAHTHTAVPAHTAVSGASADLVSEAYPDFPSSHAHADLYTSHWNISPSLSLSSSSSSSVVSHQAQCLHSNEPQAVYVRGCVDVYNRLLTNGHDIIACLVVGVSLSASVVALVTQVRLQLAAVSHSHSHSSPAQHIDLLRNIVTTLPVRVVSRDHLAVLLAKLLIMQVVVPSSSVYSMYSGTADPDAALYKAHVSAVDSGEKSHGNRLLMALSLSSPTPGRLFWSDCSMKPKDNKLELHTTSRLDAHVMNRQATAVTNALTLVRTHVGLKHKLVVFSSAADVKLVVKQFLFGRDAPLNEDTAVVTQGRVDSLPCSVAAASNTATINTNNQRTKTKLLTRARMAKNQCIYLSTHQYIDIVAGLEYVKRLNQCDWLKQ